MADSDFARPSSMRNIVRGWRYRLRCELWILTLKIGMCCSLSRLDLYADEKSLLGLDGLYDPPRLMTSASSLDVPYASSTPTSDAQPQLSPSQTTASPTVAPDGLDLPGFPGSRVSTALAETRTLEMTTPSISGDTPSTTSDGASAQSSASVTDDTNATGSSGASGTIVSSHLCSLLALCLMLWFAV